MTHCIFSSGDTCFLSKGSIDVSSTSVTGQQQICAGRHKTHSTKNIQGVQQPVLVSLAQCPDCNWRNSKINFLPPLTHLFSYSFKHTLHQREQILPLDYFIALRGRPSVNENLKNRFICDFSFLIHCLLILSRNGRNSFELVNPEYTTHSCREANQPQVEPGVFASTLRNG